MFYGYSRVFTTIGLVLVSFSRWIRSAPVIGLLPDQIASPLRDPGYVDTSSHISSGTSVKSDTNDDVFWHCGSSPKLMTIETNHETFGDESSNEWKYYNVVPHHEKWKKMDLTWSVHNYAHYPEEEVNLCINRALGLWAEAAPKLKFKQLKNNSMDANLRIKFIERMPPPYTNRTLAHAFFPKDAGWRFIEFRMNERWTLDRSYGSNALIIATHEFGHALGLYHSDNVKAIMFAAVPYLNLFHCELHPDDVQGIQHLYGGPSSAGGTPRGNNSTPRGNNGTPRGNNSTPRRNNGTPRGNNGTPRANNNPKSSSSSSSSSSSNLSNSSNSSNSSNTSDTSDSSTSSSNPPGDNDIPKGEGGSSSNPPGNNDIPEGEGVRSYKVRNTLWVFK